MYSSLSIKIHLSTDGIAVVLLKFQVSTTWGSNSSPNDNQPSGGWESLQLFVNQKEDHEPLHHGGVEDGRANESLPTHRGAFCLFTGDPWSVGDLLLLHQLPQPLDANCQQTLDQPWDLTSFDGATEEYGMGRNSIPVFLANKCEMLLQSSIIQKPLYYDRVTLGYWKGPQFGLTIK